MSGDATALVTAALFGLDGFVVLGAADAGGELGLLVEIIASLVGCRSVGRWPGAKDRHPAWVWDLPIGRRLVVIYWHKWVVLSARSASRQPGRSSGRYESDSD